MMVAIDILRLWSIKLLTVVVRVVRVPNFLIQLVFKFLDGLIKVFLRDERVGIGGITRDFYFVCKHFP